MAREAVAQRGLLPPQVGSETPSRTSHPRQDTATHLVRATTDQNWDVQEAAVQALAAGWRDDPDTLPWLRDRATTDQHGGVRQVAVQALAAGWRDDPDTGPLLRDRAELMNRLDTLWSQNPAI